MGSLLWHRLKLGAWGVLFLVLLGGLFYYLFFLPTRVPLIAAAVTDYSQLIPPNALAAEDVEGLIQTNRANMDVVGITKEHGTRESLRSYIRRQLDKVTPGGPGKKTVILYLAPTVRSTSAAAPASSWPTRNRTTAPPGFPWRTCCRTCETTSG